MRLSHMLSRLLRHPLVQRVLRTWLTAATVCAPLLALAQIPGMEDPDAKPPNCLISEFRSLALSTPELQRAEKAKAWILDQGKDCSIDRLVILRNNRNQWLGHADSADLAGQIDRLIELAAKEDPAVVKGLFTSPPPPAAPKSDQ